MVNVQPYITVCLCQHFFYLVQFTGEREVTVQNFASVYLKEQCRMLYDPEEESFRKHYFEKKKHCLNETYRRTDIQPLVLRHHYLSRLVIFHCFTFFSRVFPSVSSTNHKTISRRKVKPYLFQLRPKIETNRYKCHGLMNARHLNLFLSME